MPTFPHYQQLDAMDCGPTCLRMIAKYHGKNYSLQYLRERAFLTHEGVSLLGISDAAEAIGMRSRGVRLTFEGLAEDVDLPCICHWNQNHFVVVYKVKGEKVFVSDPAGSLLTYTKEQFMKCWAQTKVDGEDCGVALLVEPSPEFYQMDGEDTDKTNLKFLFSYVKPYKKMFGQLILGMLLGSLLQLTFPFLTQSIVDIGINNNNINFVYLILIAQLVLFVSSTAVNFIRSWILLHISTRINISIISDFLIKLMKLPVSFFDVKMTGDLIQRIDDHHRIESFLTNSSLSVVFSMMNLVIFSVVMYIYNPLILLIFFIGSALYFAWVYLFLKQRRKLDYKRFTQMSGNQSNLIQMITGMQEIKLNNCEKQKRWEWENIQAKLFKISVKGLALSQYQNSGAAFINQLKNIMISFLSAKAVIDGEMTLGMMMSVQYIIGQLNSPIEQLIGFVTAAQDAKISLERLGEIHNKEDEEETDADKIEELPEKRPLSIENISFQYEGPNSEMVLNDVKLEIPQSKVTAVVGTSGSGKTTLIKMLLGFYNPVKGDIKVGNIKLDNISSRSWRQKCGVVMQEGFIFSDTIANNIAVSDETVDKEKLVHAIHVANIQDLIETLPLGLHTKIGGDGHGLSQGQKQRILIARAVYKNPEYLFFDEATNALDANNEKIIMENLGKFFQGKTVVVVAHRLSTVRNADQIVVLDKGVITERGTHEELTKLKGAYFHLVKNQLELGS